MESNTISFSAALKKILLEGNLVYEYNPFRNYRLNEDLWFYKNKYYNNEDIAKVFGTTWSDLQLKLNNDKDYWSKIVPSYETIPILYLSGLLVDFINGEIGVSLEHPINIIPEYSYDNSVDLIINDGSSSPKIINSRFSATERNKYKIVDRSGNNDTNIYDKGPKFNIQSSLYKTYTGISNFDLMNVVDGGNLSVGLYSLYFTYVDDDGNESDIFTESGPIEVFIGNSLSSIHSGFRDLNSFKIIMFLITNLDPGYNKILLYYTKASADIYENPTVSAYKVYEPINYNKTTLFSSLTGFESKTLIPIELINQRLLIYTAVETQEICLNRLFFGHTYKVPQNYRNFRDIALRFLPVQSSEEYKGFFDSKYNYDSNIYQSSYYNPKFTYNYTGYWNDFYRFGIVFILADGTLSDVYDVRGCTNLNSSNKFTNIKFFTNEGNRNYVSWDENTQNIIGDEVNKLDITISDKSADNENARGVIRFTESAVTKIVGLKFKISDQAILYLKNDLKVRGFFFVRKKRIPTILCLAYTMYTDLESHTPALPIKEPGKPDESTEGTEVAVVESILTLNDGLLLNTFNNRLCKLTQNLVKALMAICPEYDVNTAHYNSIFCGVELPIRAYKNTLPKLYSTDDRTYDAIIEDANELSENLVNVSVLGVEDNTSLVEVAGLKFSSRVGEAEDSMRFAFAGKENKKSSATNILRGSYGPYLGVVGEGLEAGKLINLYIPGYKESLIEDYLKIRYNDPLPYYVISKLYDLNNLEDDWSKINEEWELKNPIYRGDCFICNYTHRLNRNFADPSAPTNSSVVDANCWNENFKVEDDVIKYSEFDKINLGDLNAILLGIYVTMLCKSSINLNIRSIDESNADETSLFGSPRSFVPRLLYSVDGEYKRPEALCYNSGLSKTTSERVYIGLPDAPFYKEDFTNRIAYSNIKVKDSFANGYRVFKDGQYRDYPKTYGSIIKLVESNGSLICILEHGIYKLPINERTVAGLGAGGPVFINTENILPENPLVISDKFGSQWKDSIIKTPRGIYGVDTSARKIWVVGNDRIECISDLKILKFLNDNISLEERELTPIIGIRNVKTHYNAFKGDVMFTFYDNLHGFEEKVWNVCYNEVTLLWTTFYSWVPSASENISNQYYSFDRNVSKWIAKLGASKHGNSFSDGVTLSENIIKIDNLHNNFVGKLYLDNRLLPSIKENDNTIISISTFNLLRDNYGNYKNFNISSKIYGTYEDKDDIIIGKVDENGNLKITVNPVNLTKYSEIYLKLYIKCDAVDICSELYARVTEDGTYPFGTSPDEKLDNFVTYYDGTKSWDTQTLNLWKNSVKNKNWKVYKNDALKRVYLPPEKQINGDKLVILLNINAKVWQVNTKDASIDESSALATGSTKISITDSSYYESVVAVTTDYNMQFLESNFWKHGLAGIIDRADKIYPTYWYGKQHPFEFEFIVRDLPDTQKIFDNLVIISNKAAPESFHYEIIGDGYDFAKDKKNMYIRQEATKELYAYNGSDVVYDDSYKKLNSEHRPLVNGDKDPKYYDKSTIFPLYYRRLDTINEIEDLYHLYNDPLLARDFSKYAGAEIVHYDDLNEYRIWNHVKAIDIANPDNGILNGNMQYKEDIWRVLINPINIVLKNESKDDWGDLYNQNNIPSRYDLVPAELNLFKDSSDIASLDLPNDWTRNIVSWRDYLTLNKEVKLRDKFIKIRIRYSGEDLAVIAAIKTLYSISYG